MKKFFSVVSLLALCGCLSPATPPSASYWLMEFRGAPAVANTPKYGVVRLSQIIVNLPYAGERMVVMRRDGSVAFDPQNLFAAPPSALMKGVCAAALKESGLFSDVISASSGAAASVSVEIVVRRLALDCRQEDARQAVADILVRLLDGKSISATVFGTASADATDGDYGVAFSKAVTEAVSSSLSKLR